MQTTESVTIDAPAGAVFPFVAELDQYPRWLKLVHTATPLPASSDARPAWDVELRAQVGPFARSKRLRMERTDVVDARRAVFERAEVDGRDHARWTLRVDLDDRDGTTVVTMHLAYDGRLWTGGVLERVLDDQVRSGRTGLIELVSGEPMR